MTVVLLVSTAVVTATAIDGASSPAAVPVCPGATAARATTTTTPAAGTEAAADFGSGVLPPLLLSQPERLRLVPVFDQWASICGIPAALVEATCWWESGWQEGEVSVTGAVGVCQIEPAAAATVRQLLGDASLDPHSASDNIEMSAAYLRWLLDENGGRRDLALASYYQGLTSVHHHGILPVSRPYVAGIEALLNDYRWS
jgi:soluble lytic murein transglycosylase-like protein